VGLSDSNINQIKDICNTYNVKNLYVFGSVLTTKFDNHSDIDFAVDFKTTDIRQYADNYFNFKNSLQKTLNKEIDLIEIQAIKNPYFKESLDSTKWLIYGTGN
jgi:predicted nucleotidyltransferase